MVLVSEAVKSDGEVEVDCLRKVSVMVRRSSSAAAWTKAVSIPPSTDYESKSESKNYSKK